MEWLDWTALVCDDCEAGGSFCNGCFCSCGNVPGGQSRTSNRVAMNWPVDVRRGFDLLSVCRRHLSRYEQRSRDWRSTSEDVLFAVKHGVHSAVSCAILPTDLLSQIEDRYAVLAWVLKWFVVEKCSFCFCCLHKAVDRFIVLYNASAGEVRRDEYHDCVLFLAYCREQMTANRVVYAFVDMVDKLELFSKGKL